MLTYVDLFSGCGGLSLGVESSGFDLAFAVEKSDMAARTFAHNFIGDYSSQNEWREYLSLGVQKQASQGLIVDELGTVLESWEEISDSVKDLDLVVGGPPCQGFSLAGRRDPSDLRNLLPWQFIEFVERTNPRAVVIENVVGMNQKFSNEQESSFSQLMAALRGINDGYLVQGVLVNALHYGAPQHRPRLMIIAVRDDVARLKNLSATLEIWKSDYLDKVQQVPDLAPIPTVKSMDQRTVRDAVWDLQKDLAGRAKPYVSTLNKHKWRLRSKATSKKIENHSVRKHTARVISRFQLYQLFGELGLDRKILSKIDGSNDQAQRDLVSTYLAAIEFPLKSKVSNLKFEDSNEFVDFILKLRTRKHSQKVLPWDEPARTVVTLPDDYVHPQEPRIFTVRELARFQGFPDCFHFLGKETTGSHRRRVEVPQYSQVGNAVSPWLAYSVGQKLEGILR